MENTNDSNARAVPGFPSMRQAAATGGGAPCVNMGLTKNLRNLRLSRFFRRKIRQETEMGMNAIRRRMIQVAALGCQLVGAAYLGAQTNSGPWPPPPGKVVFPQHTPEIGTLDDLIKAATLIVDSTVSLNLPTVDIETKDPGAVETDSLFTINQVIRGTRPAAAGQMLLIQTGGNHGQWEVSVTGDPLVKPGERYIFFLVPDWRGEIPNSAGVLPDKAAVPRYIRTGAEYGQALINGNGTVQLRHCISTTACKFPLSLG